MSYFHSFTERLEAVKEIKSGYPVSVYCKEHGYGRVKKENVLFVYIWKKTYLCARYTPLPISVVQTCRLGYD